VRLLVFVCGCLYLSAWREGGRETVGGYPSTEGWEGRKEG
jgi:hypothetical protein